MSGDDLEQRERSSMKSSSRWKANSYSCTRRKSLLFLQFFVFLLFFVQSQGFCRLPFSRLPTCIACRKPFLEMFEDLQKVLPGNTAHEILPVGYVLTIEEYYEQKIRNLTKEHEISTIMDEITERNKLTNVTVERDNLLERIDVQKHYYLKQIAIVSQKAVLEVLCESFIHLFDSNDKFRDLVAKYDTKEISPRGYHYPNYMRFSCNLKFESFCGII
jgi:hypothetical protein